MEKKPLYVEQGLTDVEAANRLKQYGLNKLEDAKPKTIWSITLDVLKEPMFILLGITAFIYFFVAKEVIEGLVMIFSIVLMMAIEVVQEYKTDKSLEKLKELSQPKTLVKRNGKVVEVDSEYIVPGDVMLVSEGDKISADGIVLCQNDLAVDESSLTGELDVIYKTTEEDNVNHFKRNFVYQGTNVILGSAEVKVTATGKNTQTGKIGTSILQAPVGPTPLEKQVRGLVKTVSIFALIMLIAIFSITYFKSNNLYNAVISGITFAISAIPEEFPVVLTVFLSLGAYRLSTKKSLIRKLTSVETLGGISVLCVDKTGTLTENNMKVDNVFCNNGVEEFYLKKIAVLACEKKSYDPMEQAILKYCNLDVDKLFANRLITEYPFTAKLKMMGHVWVLDDNKFTIAVKGSPESVLKICKLTEGQRLKIEQEQNEMAKKGLRVIAVAATVCNNECEIPGEISDCELNFLGLIGFIDPPRKEVAKSIEICNKAGVQVIMITGDNLVTAKSIGEQIGLLATENVLTGEQIEAMSEDELAKAVKHTNIFARVIPEQKMKIIRAIKKNGAVVAMTGDGVNDAPALKYADIGIAMGKRGTNVAKEASDMVLLDDNFSTIVETIKDGRRIYDNICKAISYVITFKLPIALMALVIPFFGLTPMLLPIHVVLLELFIDPVSALVLERQPAEKNVMTKKPRDISKGIITIRSLAKIMLQGGIIFLATFFSYVVIASNTGNENLARSFSLATLMFSNIFLIYVSVSETKLAIDVAKEFMKDKIIWLVVGFILLCLFALIYVKQLNVIFKTEPLTLGQILTVICVSFISVIWYEMVKILKKGKKSVK